MNSPPTLLRPPLPSPPAGSSWISDSSPFLPIFTMVVFIGIIVLIYAVFFAIKCPPNPFDRLRRSSGGLAGGLTHRNMNTNNIDQLVSSVAYKKGAHGTDSAGGSSGGECPVCLTAFMEEEVIREVKVCKHLFHAACIEMWLYSHFNCPVCRAFIGTNRAKPTVVDGEDDLRQGLPDSASLV